MRLSPSLETLAAGYGRGEAHDAWVAAWTSLAGACLAVGVDLYPLARLALPLNDRVWANEPLLLRWGFGEKSLDVLRVCDEPLLGEQGAVVRLAGYFSRDHSTGWPASPWPALAARGELSYGVAAPLGGAR